MRGRPTGIILRLSATERDVFHTWQRTTTLQAGVVKRGRMLLLVADGTPISHVAKRVGRSRRWVYKWIERFQQHGIAGLANQRGQGGRPRVRPAQRDGAM